LLNRPCLAIHPEPEFGGCFWRSGRMTRSDAGSPHMSGTGPRRRSPCGTHLATGMSPCISWARFPPIRWMVWPMAPIWTSTPSNVCSIVRKSGGVVWPCSARQKYLLPGSPCTIDWGSCSGDWAFRLTRGAIGHTSHWPGMRRARAHPKGRCPSPGRCAASRWLPRRGMTIPGMRWCVSTIKRLEGEACMVTCASRHATQTERAIDT
jgi:hypothetical protein